MKLLKGKGYDDKFKLLMKKNWDYGPHPDSKKKARLGNGTLRQRLDSNLIRAVLQSYFNKNKMDKYKWILKEFGTFHFYLFNKIKGDGSIIYDGIDLSQFKVFAQFNLCDQFMIFHGINSINARKETKDMIFTQMIDKPDKYNYNCQLIIEVDGNEDAKYFINTIGRHSMEAAFQNKVCIYIIIYIQTTYIAYTFVTQQ